MEEDYGGPERSNGLQLKQQIEKCCQSTQITTEIEKIMAQTKWQKPKHVKDFPETRL